MNRRALKIRWYQDAIVNGKPMPFRRNKRDSTTRRWTEYIKPLLVDGSVFVDIGCNAGYCCREMIDRGFTSYGIERDPTFFDCASYWEEHDPKGTKLINADVHDIDLPCADIVLMAYLHYWQTHEQLVELEKKLRQKAVNVIFLTRHTSNRRYLSPVYKEYLIGLFRHWDIADETSGKYTSIRFKNRELFTQPVDDVLYDPRFRVRNARNPFTFQNAFKQFVELIQSGKEFDPKETLNYQYILTEGSLKRSADVVINSQLEWVKDILDNGFKEPCGVRKQPGKRAFLRDGNHRKVIAEMIGQRNLVCRMI